MNIEKKVVAKHFTKRKQLSSIEMYFLCFIPPLYIEKIKNKKQNKKNDVQLSKCQKEAVTLY